MYSSLVTDAIPAQYTPTDDPGCLRDPVCKPVVIAVPIAMLLIVLIVGGVVIYKCKKPKRDRNKSRENGGFDGNATSDKL